jgi:hypothetical protein
MFLILRLQKRINKLLIYNNLVLVLGFIKAFNFLIFLRQAKCIDWVEEAELLLREKKI